MPETFEQPKSEELKGLAEEEKLESQEKKKYTVEEKAAMKGMTMEEYERWRQEEYENNEKNRLKRIASKERQKREYKKAKQRKLAKSEELKKPVEEEFEDKGAKKKKYTVEERAAMRCMTVEQYEQWLKEYKQSQQERHIKWLEVKIRQDEMAKKAEEERMEEERMKHARIEKMTKEWERRELKIAEQLSRLADKLKQEGLSVKIDCRINMDDFAQTYTSEDIAEDKKECKMLESKYEGQILEHFVGNTWEGLKTLLFNKFLGDKFVIVRTSVYDDLRNGVDNLMIERETGNIVCMFDEANLSNRYVWPLAEKKLNKVVDKNRRGGGGLKYGLSLDDEDLVSPTALKNIPVFALIASRISVARLSDEFTFEGKTETEIHFLEAIFQSLKEQCDFLEKENLSLILRERLKIFKEVLGKIGL